MFFLMILAFMATALYSMVPVEQNSARYNQLDTQAHYVATAGVKHALAWLDAVIDPATVGVNAIGTSWNPQDNPFACPSTGEPYEVKQFGVGIPGTPQDFPYNMQPATQAEAPGVDDTWYPSNIKVLQLKANQFTPAQGWITNVTIFPDKYTWCGVSGGPWPATAIGQPKPSCYTVVALAGLDANGNGVIDTNIGERWRLRAKSSVTIDTFAKYAYLSDQNPADIYFGVKNSARPTVDGPFHTNQTPLFNAAEGAAFWNQPLTATSTYAFTGQVSFSTRIEASTMSALTGQIQGSLTYDGIGWYDGNWMGSNPDKRPYTDNTTPNASRYNRLVSGGEAQIKQVQAITLPADTGSVAAAAWGFGEDGTAQNNLVTAADKKYQLYVNTGSSGTTPKGGVLITGSTKQTLLQVLDSNGLPIGDGSASSAVPTTNNTGNAALKVVMDTRLDAVVANGSVTYPSSSQGAAAGWRAWTYGASQYVNQSNTVNVPTNGSFTSNINYTSNYTKTSNVNYTSNVMKTSNVNYTSNYTGSCAGSYLSAGGGGGSGQMNWVTTNGPCPKTAPATSQSAPYPAPQTFTSQSAPYTASAPATSQSAPYTSNYTAPSQYFTGSALQQGNRVTYNSAVQPASNWWVTSNQTVTYTAASMSITTQRFNPTDMVIEMTTRNGVSMSMSASAIKPGASFLINGVTQAALQATTNMDTIVIKQYRGTSYGAANPDLFVVSQLTGPLNGAVRINGDAKGLEGWNKGKRTIAAESRSYFAAGASYTMSYNSIRIGDNVRQYDTTPGTLPQNYQNNLGLIASNIDVSVDRNLASASYGPSNPLKIYAVMLAYKKGFGARIAGRFDDDNDDNDYNENTGNKEADFRFNNGAGVQAYLSLYGGVIQMVPGVLKQTVGTSFIGWDNQYFYDPVNAISPPPYFPVLSDFTIYHYQEDRLYY